MSKSPVLLEICAGSVTSCLAAQEGGAGRVEFCDNLLEGGTTPSYGAIASARDKLRIPLNVIIRPRGGDFLYSDVEFEVMERDIRLKHWKTSSRRAATASSPPARKPVRPKAPH